MEKQSYNFLYYMQKFLRFFIWAHRLFPPPEAARSPSGYPLKFRRSFARFNLS
jgi:hypothetical protein